MSTPAAVLLVFGRGVVRTGEGFDLTPAGAARVAAAVSYVEAHAYARPPRVVFTGGWPQAGPAAPPAGQREGDLMLAAARAAGLHRHAELCAETRSRTTLENLLNTAEDGLLDAGRPVGLVTHAWHLPRVRFLAGRALGLRGPDLLDVPAGGGEDRDERALLLATRLALAGARGHAGLRRRERGMVAAAGLTRRWRRPPA